MNKLSKLRDFSLKAIILITWFEVLWVIITLFATMFSFTFITSKLQETFYIVGPLGLIGLLGFLALNIAVNLNIISITQESKLSTEEKPTSTEDVYTKPAYSKKLFALASISILVVLLCLAVAEYIHYTQQKAELISKLKSAANSSLASSAIKVIANDGKIRELGRIRDGLAEMTSTGGRLSILIPRKVQNTTVYYELTAWYYSGDEKDAKISEADLSYFQPEGRYREKFDMLRDGKITSFVVVVNRSYLKAFYRANSKLGHIILVVDTSRQIRYSSWK